MRSRAFFFRIGCFFQCAVQPLTVVPGFGGMESLAAEKCKIRLTEVGHGKLPGTQSLIFELQLAVGRVVAILAVAQDGAADAGHMSTDLVGAAGDKPDLQQRQTTGDRDGLVLGLHFLGAWLLILHDLYDAAVGVLEQVAAQGGIRRHRTAKGDAEVGLFHFAVLDGGQEQFLGFRGLCNDHKTAGAGVQPVAQGRGIQVVLFVLALLVQVEQRTVQKGVVLRAVHGKAGRFVHDQNLRAVVHHLCRTAGVFPRRALHAFVGVQHFVQNEQFDLIAGHHAGGERLLFAVELDLVFAQGLVQAARVQRRVLLHQIIVKPCGGQTFYF